MIAMLLAVVYVYLSVQLDAPDVLDVLVALALALEVALVVLAHVQEGALALVRVDVLVVQELAQEDVLAALVRVPGDALDVLAALVRVPGDALDVLAALVRVLVRVQDAPALVADVEGVLDVVLTALEDVQHLVRVVQTQVVSQDAEVVIVALDVLDAVGVEVLQSQFHQLRNLKFYMVKKEK